MTAKEYLKLCGESLEMPKKDITERSEELLSLVGLANENHRIKGYSRGMKQRLGIAQALAAKISVVGDGETVGLLLNVTDQGEYRLVIINPDLTAVRGNQCPCTVPIIFYHTEHRQVKSQ